MRFSSPLVDGILIRRYKRFLADCTLADTGETITASVPNTGSMLGLNAPGSAIRLSVHDSATRKYRHMLEMVHADQTWVGINTGLPNALAEEAIARGLVPVLSGYPVIQREQRYGENSRIDIKLSGGIAPDAYVEVKNVHFMRQPGLAEFPDTATARGTKHLRELAQMARQGFRAVMLYVVQREDCDALSICSDLDPAYAHAFRDARAAGVEAFAVKCHISEVGIEPVAVIPVSGLE